MAFAGCPLLLDDRLVGVLALFARHPLNRHTMSALAAIAPTMAMGIDRKRLEAVGRLDGGITPPPPIRTDPRHGPGASRTRGGGDSPRHFPRTA